MVRLLTTHTFPFLRCIAALDKASPDNWLDDNIWLKKAYLGYRAPLLINSNWWLAFQNDEGVPDHVLRGQTNDHVSGISPWQVRRAAWLVHRILEFKDRLATCVIAVL